MISDIWMISDNFPYIYSIMWVSMKKKNTDIIFKIPIDPAQSQHIIIEKTHCKKRTLELTLAR